MRRSVAATLVALSTALAVLPATTSSATDAPLVRLGASGQSTGQSAGQSAGATRQERAEQALARATALLAGSPGTLARQKAGTAEPVDASLVLRDLFVARPDLDGAAAEQADQILARPDDGAADPQGFGYSVPATQVCQGKFCVHYVTTGDDAATPESVAATMKTMKKVYRLEVKKLGYRKPLSDGPLGGNNGGNAKFDVYLKNLGVMGLYGYCAPEFAPQGAAYGGGYCTLDNDFSTAEFGAPPENSLKVTAAHEFFHAVQFNYSLKADSWLSESTATWMEERFADNVNDNRQYIPSSQLQVPNIPLDTFVNGQTFQYGNWLWWEYLSSRYGKGIVKTVWNRVSARPGAPDDYSVQALTKVLRSKGGFNAVFTRYSAGNTVPRKNYPEGKAYPSAPFVATGHLGKKSRSASGKVRLAHLTSGSFRISPDKTLTKKKWKLRVTVKGPNRVTGPGAYVLVKTKKGKGIAKAIPLNARGNGRVVLSFSKKRVKSVTVTLVNASTRYKCNRNNPYFACAGNPLDDKSKFKVQFKVVK